MSVNAVISMRPEGQDMGGGRREEDDSGRWFSSLASEALTGFPTQGAAPGLSSRCLASHNLQNAHPFAEVWKMGGGEGVKGGGDVRSSDPYRRGGLESPRVQ